MTVLCTALRHRMELAARSTLHTAVGFTAARTSSQRCKFADENRLCSAVYQRLTRSYNRHSLASKTSTRGRRTCRTHDEEHQEHDERRRRTTYKSL